MVFVDISGFTALSEKLAKLGRVGAEEMAEAINGCFTELLVLAYEQGGSLLKFGGDALLVLFPGGEPADQAARAARAAIGMRKRLRQVGRIQTPGGRVNLRMSVGMHAGAFDLFLVGDSHRELIVTGPAATEVVDDGGHGRRRRDRDEPDGRRAAARLLARRREGRRGVLAWRARRRGARDDRGPARGTGRAADAQRAARHPRLAARGRDRARAPAGGGGIHPLRRHRRADRARRAGRAGRRARPARPRHAGGGRRARRVFPRLRRRRRRGQADLVRRRPARRRRGRGAPLAVAAPDRRARALDRRADRCEPRPGVRGRHRSALPAHLHRDGRHREPRGAIDGQGRRAGGLRERLGARTVGDPVRDHRARALLRERKGEARPGMVGRPADRTPQTLGRGGACAARSRRRDGDAPRGDERSAGRPSSRGAAPGRGRARQDAAARRGADRLRRLPALPCDERDVHRDDAVHRMARGAERTGRPRLGGPVRGRRREVPGVARSGRSIAPAVVAPDRVGGRRRHGVDPRG